MTCSYDQICEDGFSTVFLWDVVPGASIVQYEHAWIFPGPSLRFTLWKGWCNRRGQLFAPPIYFWQNLDNLTKDIQGLKLHSPDARSILLIVIIVPAWPLKMFRSTTINRHESVPAPPHPMMPRWHHLHPHGIRIHFPSVRIQDRNQRHHNTLGRGQGVLSIAHKNGWLKPGYACSSGWYASKAVDANLKIAPKNEDWITWNVNCKIINSRPAFSWPNMCI